MKIKVNKKQLAKGTRIEQGEHHLGLKLSRKIASDHLKEHPNMYK
jgi:hypothetical protein